MIIASMDLHKDIQTIKFVELIIVSVVKLNCVQFFTLHSKGKDVDKF